MLKPLMITTLLALAAPQADAGDVKVRFGFDSRTKDFRIGFGYRDRKRDIRFRGGNHGHHDVCCPVYVRGHYDTVKRRVWIPATYKRVWHEAEYAYRYDRCGRRVRVLVSEGHWDRVRVPGRHVIRYEKVWHGPRWEYRCGHDHGHDRAYDRGRRHRSHKTRRRL